jgi:hypothetical protein
MSVRPTCSTIHLGLERELGEIASALADDVVVPVGTTCYGTAGDRGLLHPELVVSGICEEKSYLDANPPRRICRRTAPARCGRSKRPVNRTSHFSSPLRRRLALDLLRHVQLSQNLFVRQSTAVLSSIAP